jgi:hypothetical protein
MSKVSDGRSVRVGLVGPKPRLGSVGDGQRVNIPVPDGGESKVDWATLSRRLGDGGKRGKPVIPGASQKSEVAQDEKSLVDDEAIRPYHKPTLVDE